MTPLSKVIITIGIGIFTAGSLLWIILQEWRWFAGGLSVFGGCLLAAVVLSIETKPSNATPIPFSNTTANTPANTDADDWEQPNTPPPDKEYENDPFRT